jgi:hypothetical protein
VPLRNPPPGGGTLLTATYRLGPFTLAPEGMPGDQNQGTTLTVPRPAGSFGLKGITFDLVDSGGTPVPRDVAHLHHVVLSRAGTDDPLCGANRFFPGSHLAPFAGSGSERTPLSLAYPYAYLVGASDPWSALWHVMNMSMSTRTVYIQYTMRYQPAATAANTRGVVPFFMDVTGCGNAEFDVPGTGGPGSTYTRSRSWQAPFDGIAVFAGGHLHAGGIDLVLRRETPRILGCRMQAMYDGMDHDMDMVESISWCRMHDPVQQGASYSVRARYDNSQPRHGVMGIVLAYVWPGRQ